MEEGEIVESGSHDKLVKAKGIYSDLWSRQSGGFLSVDDVEEIQAAE